MENSSDDMDSYDVDDYIFGGGDEDKDNLIEAVKQLKKTHEDIKVGDNDENEEDDFIKIVNYVITHDLALLKGILDKKIDEDPDFDINRTFEGSTLLMLAVKYNHIAVVEYLLSKKPDVKKPDVQNKLTPLMQAVMNDNTKIVKLLVEAGADISKIYEKDEQKINIRDFSYRANSNIYKILDTNDPEIEKIRQEKLKESEENSDESDSNESEVDVDDVDEINNFIQQNQETNKVYKDVNRFNNRFIYFQKSSSVPKRRKLLEELTTINESLKKTEDPKQKRKLLKKCRAKIKSIKKLKMKIERAQKKTKYYLGFIHLQDDKYKVWYINNSFVRMTEQSAKNENKGELCKLVSKIQFIDIKESVIPNSIVLKNKKVTDEEQLIEATENFKTINVFLMKRQIFGYKLFIKEIDAVLYSELKNPFYLSLGINLPSVNTCKKIKNIKQWNNKREDYIDDYDTDNNDRWCVISEKILRDIFVSDEKYGTMFKTAFENLDKNDPDKCDRIPSIYKELLNQSATKIQALFRGHSIQKEIRDMAMEEEAAKWIQTAYRRHKKIHDAAASKETKEREEQ